MPVVQHNYLKLRIIRKFYFFLSLPIAKSRIVDPIFHLHTICTKIPLPYAAEGLARVKIRRGGLAKPQSRKVRRGGRQELQELDPRNPPRRAGLPAVGRQEPRSERLVKDLSIPLRPPRRAGLCALARRKKEKIIGAQRRQAAKSPPRRTGGSVFFVQILGREVYPDVRK